MTPFERVRPGQKFKPSAARENMLSDVARRQLMPIAPPSVRTSPPGGGGVIPVICSQTGGDAGEFPGSRCSFTYTISHIGGGEIATDVAIEGYGSRTLITRMDAGTRGLAFKNASDEWKLIWVDEIVALQHNCNAPV